MWKKLLFAVSVIAISFTCVYGLVLYTFDSPAPQADILRHAASSVGIERNEVLGFLPYWLLDKADGDYTKYLTTLAYFALTVEPDGTIQKYVNPGEAEPGWYALRSGKADEALSKTQNSPITRSLVVFAGNEELIGNLIQDPIHHADNLIREISPLMKEHEFTDLNLDIESVAPEASNEARLNFTRFVQEVRRLMNEQKLGTLSIDSSPTDLIKKRLIDVPSIISSVDRIILMTYDYHYQGSSVTGPVSPVGGVPATAEFDIQTALTKAVEVLPKDKILLGTPLYGYEWETIGTSPRSAVMPGSGTTISNRRMEEFVATCASCSAQLDTEARESYVIYTDSETGMVHQVFYPDKQAMIEKIKLSQTYKIGGIALWALGYEGKDILSPLERYKQSFR